VDQFVSNLIGFTSFFKRKPCPAFEVRPQRRDGAKKEKKWFDFAHHKGKIKYVLWILRIILLMNAFLSFFLLLFPRQRRGIPPFDKLRAVSKVELLKAGQVNVPKSSAPLSQPTEGAELNRKRSEMAKKKKFKR
jgi:hypothetical protein